MLMFSLQAADKVKEEFGTIDILINNAGIVTGRKFLDCPDSLIEKTMEVNANAHFWVSMPVCVGTLQHTYFGLVVCGMLCVNKKENSRTEGFLFFIASQLFFFEVAQASFNAQKSE